MNRIIGQNKKTAVILMNLGGPDSLDAVKPFLFNLFKDPAIISAPLLVRYMIAWLISTRRTPVAQEIYKQMGGSSPIVQQTQAQAQALENYLSTYGQVKTFICMRYWHPMSGEVVEQVKAYHPDEVILLPLYPQFSTSTTESSINDWKKIAEKKGLNVSTHVIGCYLTQIDFIHSHVKLIKEYSKNTDFNSTRILFSAHGLPEKIIQLGDPYQWQVEQTAQAIVDILAIKDLDWKVTYQSRVGPLKWIGPSTDEEIKLAGKEEKSLIIVPIAFVSEHSETLVELDIEYKELAHKFGVSQYIRIPALGIQDNFIQALGNMCLNVEKEKNCTSHLQKRLCPSQFNRCICK